MEQTDRHTFLFYYFCRNYKITVGLYFILYKVPKFFMDTIFPVKCKFKLPLLCESESVGVASEINQIDQNIIQQWLGEIKTEKDYSKPNWLESVSCP